MNEVRRNQYLDLMNTVSVKFSNGGCEVFTSLPGNVLSDQVLKQINYFFPDFITPFIASSVKEVNGLPIISKGLSSAGYDASLAEEVLLVTDNELVDPKRMSSELNTVKLPIHEDSTGRYCILPAGQFALAHTVETFHIPDNVVVTCIGKSTYARAGLHVLVTPLEPGWAGQVTLELKNETDGDMKLYIDEGVCQFVFNLTTPVAVTYGDRNGKYQGQSGVTMPTV